MPRPIRFLFALHNHQPIGNFEHVFEQSYQESYLPFLNVFERFPSIRMGLHTSGSLMEWLDAEHPDYVDRLADLVKEGRIEILGGPMYEPILAMLPSRDRIGQINAYTTWLESRLGTDVTGMWIPERVWEQSYVADLAHAGMKYTILDDFHFKNAGLSEDDLSRHFVTEDHGRILSIFPGSERLRYLIPFGTPEEVIDHFAAFSEQHTDPVITFGDDGEKFGTWPDTYHYVYEERWLERFFEALQANADWIRMVTPSEALDEVPPTGKIYLPEASYREMTEWSMPSDRQVDFDRLRNEMADDARWSELQRYLRGGYWRNFKVRYPESDEMYTRMMAVSQRLARATEAGYKGPRMLEAADALYRGQCNCSYWHGAFGGIYLPHLRNAVYSNLIRADNLLDRIAEKGPHWVEAKVGDFNFDGINEVRLSNARLHALVAPRQGGHLYELDVKSICHNLLATISRGHEAYHEKVRAGSREGEEACSSIHDRVIFKQEGLDEALQYDAYPRKSLIDLFYDCDVDAESVRRGTAAQKGSFVHADYEAVVRRKTDRIQVLLSHEGTAYGAPVRVKKAITLSAGSNVLEVAYKLENLPRDYRLHFAVEMNFAGLPGEADDRFFRTLGGDRLGHLGSALDLQDQAGLALADQWLGIDVRMEVSRPTHFYTFPVQSVSQSEGGFELVHQSVAVQPHWFIEPDEHGDWSVVMNLVCDTTLSEERLAEDSLVEMMS
jgi:alpha-amylase